MMLHIQPTSNLSFEYCQETYLFPLSQLRIAYPISHGLTSNVLPCFGSFHDICITGIGRIEDLQISPHKVDEQLLINSSGLSTWLLPDSLLLFVLLVAGLLSLLCQPKINFLPLSTFEKWAHNSKNTLIKTHVQQVFGVLLLAIMEGAFLRKNTEDAVSRNFVQHTTLKWAAIQNAFCANICNIKVVLKAQGFFLNGFYSSSIPSPQLPIYLPGSFFDAMLCPRSLSPHRHRGVNHTL